MAKALELNASTLSVIPSVPRAAQAAMPALKEDERKREKAAVKSVREPLQVRWPAEEVKAVKLAALHADTTVSEFMLSCFHARMKKETE